jgi:hypothetical protein
MRTLPPPLSMSGMWAVYTAHALCTWLPDLDAHNILLILQREQALADM